MRCRAGLLAAAIALATAACTRSDSDVSTAQQVPREQALREAAQSVVLCQTADSTLLRRLGHPSRDGVLHRERVMSWLALSDTLTRYLAVLLDSTGTVVDMYWDVPSEVPWVPTNQCLPPASEG